ncbi:MAG: magnesium/cobalt transporter CorA [Deltaproteobacteria bacterium]|nr:magnesium/cobalt transporter CorA [Deltaproteobacteria bacterium]
MARRFKKRSKKAGLPPGALVHIGDRLTEKVGMEVVHYNEAVLEKKDLKSLAESAPYLKQADAVTWIQIEGLHDVDKLAKLETIFGIHPLILEDIFNSDQRPKMEDLGDYIYIVLKMFNGQNGDNVKIAFEQISIILGKNYVISIMEKENAVLKPIRDRLETGAGKIRKLGADYLAYAIIDAVVDNYFIVLEQFGEKMESMEEASLKNPTPETLHAIQDIKGEMIFLRRSVWPLREAVGSLARSESPLIQDTTVAYLKDIYDHTVQVIDNIETLRDMLSGMLDIYLSSLANRTNKVMKTLTVIATIFIPLTFIVGVYGMNFKYMPELEWRWGYFAVWGVILIVAAGMLIYFRKRKW